MIDKVDRIINRDSNGLKEKGLNGLIVKIDKLLINNNVSNEKKGELREKKVLLQQQLDQQQQKPKKKKKRYKVCICIAIAVLFYVT